MEESKENGKNEIYSQRVRAGKRTYFFDIKATRSNDYYLTITESKRRYKEDGYFYEKHKIFLYKEDFNKFFDALQETIDHVKTELMPEYDFTQVDHYRAKESSSKPSAEAEPVKDTGAVEDATTEPDINSEAETETETETEPEIKDAADSELKWD